MLVQVAYSIPNNDFIVLDNMFEKWVRFKVLREEGYFDNDPQEGFITMRQRERMLDDVFHILGFGGKNDSL